jgi:GxxExxY protein
LFKRPLGGKMLFEELTGKVIEAFYNVYNVLGYGFLEKVYEKSMLVELKSLGLKAVAQKEIVVMYKGIHVGQYFADLLIEDKIIVELKAEEKISNIHKIQLLNYLKATDVEVGLLLNFGKNAEFKRIVNSKKYQRESGRSA